MTDTSQSPSATYAVVDQIPVLWFEPFVQRPVRQLIILLTGLGTTKEGLSYFLKEISRAGFVALSFDPWQHGERATEAQGEILNRVFGNFRRYMWPILGQTTLDTLRVIDWAVDTLGVEPAVTVAGLSMGGDVAVAAAGIDHRIERVAAVIATPDWLRPGMHDVFNPEILLPPGEPDAYARFFYDHLNPLTHLAAYAHGPAINFICGEQDIHVPPDGALRFKSGLQEHFPVAAKQVLVNLIPGMGHLDIWNYELWWPQTLAWLTGT